MDEAAIFTIHGFCQRMLSLNAFESGMLFEQQLIEDESVLCCQAWADFWRRHCYPLTAGYCRSAYMRCGMERPGTAVIDRYRPLSAGRSAGSAAPAAGMTVKPPGIAPRAAIIARIADMKAQWRAVGEEVLTHGRAVRR